jgi:hypothetical protein
MRYLYSAVCTAYALAMKPVVWLEARGRSQGLPGRQWTTRVTSFSGPARLDPDDWKPMPSSGRRPRNRVRDQGIQDDLSGDSTGSYLRLLLPEESQRPP